MKNPHPWNCVCLKCSWQYTRNCRKHYIYDGEFYTNGPHHHLWEICSSAPYGQYQDKHGYDLYHKGKLLEHGKTVKELKLIVEQKGNQE